MLSLHLPTTTVHQLDEYIRRANQDKSYEAVMAEWSIKRLKKDVKAARSKLLHARAKPTIAQAATTRASGTVLSYNALDSQSMPSIPPGRKAMPGISGDQLLEASINTAQRLSVQLQQEKHKKGQGNDAFNPNTELSPTKFTAMASRTGTAAAVSLGGSDSPFKQPSSPQVLHSGRGTSPNWWDAHNESIQLSQSAAPSKEDANGDGKPGGQAFMAGAAWLGRSVVLLSDALGDDVERLRSDIIQRQKVRKSS